MRPRVFAAEDLLQAGFLGPHESLASMRPRVFAAEDKTLLEAEAKGVAQALQ